MIKARIEFLQSNLKDSEAALISSDADRLYYTGFASSAGYVAVTRKKAVFLIDFRYFEKAKRTTKPTLIHCKTLKGKGYQLAEMDETGFWHAPGRFKINDPKAEAAQIPSLPWQILLILFIIFFSYFKFVYAHCLNFISNIT